MKSILGIFFFISASCFGQIEFEDFVQTETQAFVLSNDGRITSWNLKTLEKLGTSLNDSLDKIISLAKDANDQVFAGTEKGNIYIVSSDLTLKEFLKSKYYPIKYIFFNSSNKLLLIVPNAVYDPVSKRHWRKFKNHTNGLIVKRKVLWLFPRKTDTYFQMPQYAFLDSNDRIWMIASFGEFGGDLQIFDTRQLKIVDNKIDSISFGLFFPKSVFEGNNGDIFITSGLQHFMNSGEIYRITPGLKANRVFKSDGPRKANRKTGEVLDEGGMFVGPGAYDKNENSISFTTERGFYKLHFDNNGKPGKPELIVKPELTWSREALAIGVSMAIKRMEFTSDGRFLFLSKKDGLAIYDQGSITFLR